MEYFKLKVTSNAVDLHGVLLRDGIRKKIMENEEFKKTSGLVTNIPNGIEVICGSELKDKLEPLVLEAIQENPLIELKERSYYKFEPIGNKIFDQFELKRSGELQETVWALQGAGKVFQQIGDKIETRDKRKHLGLLRGVKYELFFNNTQVNRSEDLCTRAIENFLVEIPVDDNRLIESMQAYLSECKSVKGGLNKQKSKLSELENALEVKLKAKISILESKLGESEKENNKNVQEEGGNDDA